MATAPSSPRRRARPGRLHRQRGVTLIEYGLIASLVALLCLAVVIATGQSLLALWQFIRTGLGAVAGG